MQGVITSGTTAQGAAPGELSELAGLLLSGDAVRLAVAVDAAGRAAGIGEMRVFTQRGLYSRRILEQMGWQQLQSQILNLEQAEPDADPGRATGLALKRSSEMLRDRVREYVEDQYLMFASANARELRESVLRSARLSHLERRYLEQINRLVRRIARKLSARYSRRRRSFRRGRLDVPRTLRAGAAHDRLAASRHRVPEPFTAFAGPRGRLIGATLCLALRVANRCVRRAALAARGISRRPQLCR